MQNLNDTYLKNLKEDDVWTLIMYTIYKCTGIQEYSLLSELVYTLDKKNLLNLCAILGGTTIRIPTIDELNIFTEALAVFQTSEAENLSFHVAFRKNGFPPAHKPQVANIYNMLKGIINEYKGNTD